MQKPQTEIESNTAAAGPPEKRHDVLIVDDNVDALDMMADVVDFLGYQPHAATDADVALELAERVKPAIALLDITLPLMDGYELGRRLRVLPDLADIKLVALTGHGSPEDREKSRVAGFVSHLVKPVDLVALGALLRSLKS